MKNILLFIDNLGSGGAQNQLTQLSIELKLGGYGVTVATYFPQDFFKSKLEENNISFFYIPKKSKIGIEVILGIRKLIKTENIDVVISYLDTPNFYSTTACFTLIKNVKCIISYRSMTSFSALSKLELFFRTWSNRIADHIVCNSHHERLRWIEKYPRTENKWTTIYNMIDFDRFQENDKKRKDHYLVVGSISEAKNGLYVIDSLKKLRDNNYPIKIKWIGQQVKTITARKQYLEKMKSKIVEYNLHSNFIWLPPINHIQKEYEVCRALILVSSVEGLPNVVCEALATGTPCIVSNLLDHPRIVKNYETGLLVDITNENDLVNRIMEMETIVQSPKYKEMCKNALSSAKELFAKKIFIDNYCKIIEN